MDNSIPQGLDPTAFILTKAIGRSESPSGSYSASGDDSTSTGRYQIQNSNWKPWAKEYLGDENAPMTEENQNKLAYTRVKSLLDKGYTQSQVASIWNHGSPDYKGVVGDKKYPDGKVIHYDVPSYVSGVQKQYLQAQNEIKKGYNPTPFSNPDSGKQQNSQGQNTQDPQTPPSQLSQAENDLGSGNYGGALGHGLLAAGSGIEKGLNWLSSPFAGLAAIPTQLIAKGLGEQDPFQKGIGNQGNAPTPVSNLDVGSKVNDAVKAGTIATTVTGGAGLIKGLAGAAGALGSPLLEGALPVSMKVFQEGSAVDKLNYIKQGLKYASENPNGAGQEILLKKAMQEITPLAEKELGTTPGLVSKLIKSGASLGKGYLLQKALGDTIGGIFHKITGN